MQPNKQRAMNTETNGAWQRQLTENALRATKRIFGLEQL